MNKKRIYTAIVDPIPGKPLTIEGIGECTVVEPMRGFYNSVIHVVDPELRHFMVKQSHNPMPGDVAEKFCDDLRAYVTKLEKAGVHVPAADQISFGISQNEKGDLYVMEVAPFWGPTAEQFISLTNSRYECTQVTRRIMRCIIPLLLNSKTGDTMDLGIDPIPRNFCMHEGRAYYVDYFVPKEYDGKTFRLEHPQPEDEATYQVGIWRHYHKVGIVTVLVIQLARIKPAFLHYFGAVAESMIAGHPSLRDVQRGVRDYFSRLETSSPIQLREWVNECDFSTIYDLRAIACELTRRRAMTAGELEAFFSSSHFLHRRLTDMDIKGLQQNLVARIV